ncbi:transposable element Tcb2 transposase [Trichonephila clavipes]|nr:transposable element Tcb2 transposase [Trichonephila clavipes]
MTVNDRTASSWHLASHWSTRWLRQFVDCCTVNCVQRAWQADWLPVVFLDESRFNWGHDGRIRVRRYVGERYLPECVIGRHSNLTPGLMPEVVPFLLGKTVRDLCSSQHMQLLPWPAYSPYLSPIEYMWDLLGRCLTQDPRLVASKDELLLHIQKVWNSLPQADMQNLFDSMPRRIATLITARAV